MARPAKSPTEIGSAFVGTAPGGTQNRLNTPARTQETDRGFLADGEQDDDRGHLFSFQTGRRDGLLKR